MRFLSAFTRKPQPETLHRVGVRTEHPRTPAVQQLFQLVAGTGHIPILNPDDHVHRSIQVVDARRGVLRLENAGIYQLGVNEATITAWLSDDFPTHTTLGPIPRGFVVVRTPLAPQAPLLTMGIARSLEVPVVVVDADPEAELSRCLTEQDVDFETSLSWVTVTEALDEHEPGGHASNSRQLTAIQRAAQTEQIAVIPDAHQQDSPTTLHHHITQLRQLLPTQYQALFCEAGADLFLAQQLHNAGLMPIVLSHGQEPVPTGLQHGTNLTTGQRVTPGMKRAVPNDSQGKNRARKFSTSGRKLGAQKSSGDFSTPTLRIPKSFSSATLPNLKASRRFSRKLRNTLNMPELV